jgi:hypothetical protein
MRRSAGEDSSGVDLTMCSTRKRPSFFYEERTTGHYRNGGFSWRNRSPQENSSHLPADLRAVVLVVQHWSPDVDWNLTSVLSKAGPLTVVLAQNGDVLEPGRIYLAPPNHHLWVKGGRPRVTGGPRENLWRPSIDTMFRSIAVQFRNRAIGVMWSAS